MRTFAMVNHEQYMWRCLQLAAMGAGAVAPNPMVGAVLVYQDAIIGEGYHQTYGKAHAEVNCINSVRPHHQAFIPDSTLYVSLEPCAHYGKTPPCALFILQHQIKTVVVGCRDSYEEVNGRGIELLETAGVTVIKDVLKLPCQQLNRAFFTFHEKKRPFVLLKWAQSADGKIAGVGSERTFISNPLTNIAVHRWRSQVPAIMVGTQTALKDQPSLTTRLWPGKNPLRILIDKNLRVTAGHPLLDGTVPSLVFNYQSAGQQHNLQFVQLNKEEDFLQQMLTHLYQQNIQQVMVEGGAALLQSFIDQGLWDEARIITNEALFLGEGLDVPVLKGGSLRSTERIAGDRLQFYHANQALFF